MLKFVPISGLESCNGSFKFLGGFRDVAQFLESHEEKVEMNGTAKANGHVQKRSGSANSICNFSLPDVNSKFEEESNCCYTPKKSSTLSGKNSPCSDCYMTSRDGGSPFVITPVALPNPNIFS